MCFDVYIAIKFTLCGITLGNKGSFIVKMGHCFMSCINNYFPSILE